MYQQFSHYWNFKLDFNYGNISIESKDDLKFEEVKLFNLLIKNVILLTKIGKIN